MPQEPARAVAASASVAAQASLPQRESPPPHTQQMSRTAAHSSGEPELQDAEERKGPFTFGGQTFTVVAHSKRVPGKQGESALALASLDIADAAGAILHHEEFPHSVENGEFTETCSVSGDAVSVRTRTRRCNFITTAPTGASRTSWRIGTRSTSSSGIISAWPHATRFCGEPAIA